MNSIIRIATMSLLLCLPMLVQAEDALDRDSVYRADPKIKQLNAVPLDEIKLGFIYKYYSESLEKHVWGIAVEDGKFRYAFGPGSMQPTSQFDLRLTKSQEQQLIIENAPALSRVVEGLGRTVFARLDANDEWKINLSTSIPKVFDQLTSRRWEWHGDRRVAIVHTHGPYWAWEADRILPMTVSFQ